MNGQEYGEALGGACGCGIWFGAICMPPGVCAVIVDAMLWSQDAATAAGPGAVHICVAEGIEGTTYVLGGKGTPLCPCSTRRRNRCSRRANSAFAISVSDTVA
jgi:hypothetical protein